MAFHKSKMLSMCGWKLHGYTKPVNIIRKVYRGKNYNFVDDIFLKKKVWHGHLNEDSEAYVHII